tara:strand:+ start:859 stop:1476 length:618 start_codon:yes stop_codon:yes gene_type:complete
MKKFGFNHKEEALDPFTDLLFNGLLGFAFMFAIAFMLIKPAPEEAKIDPEAEYIITVTWPDEHPDDIDTYVEDPQGNIVWYHIREAGLMHLDRDDRGNYKDTIMVDGVTINNPLNQETVTLRGIVSGEYVVNVYHYLANTVDEIPVKVKVEKVNPQLKVIFYDTLFLDGKGTELTAARFVLDKEGQTISVQKKQKKLTVLTRQRK